MHEDLLIAELKNKSNEAFDFLVRNYENMVFNTVLGIVQNHTDAEDVSQDVFIKIFQSIHNFRGDSKLSTWVYRICITKAIDFVRSKKTRKGFGFFKEIIGLTNTHEPTADVLFYHPGVSLDNKESAAILFKAIKQLPNNQKAAFVLIKTEGLSYNTVAQILEISEKAVEGLMHRAKENLRKTLEEFYTNK